MKSQGSSHLVAYGIAASAALAASARATVIYSGPQNIAIAQFSSQQIDLNLDGTNDILLKNYVFGGGNYQGATVNVFPGKIVGFSSGFGYVSNLGGNTTIGSGSSFATFYGSLAYGASNPNAQFNNVTGAFIGLSFPVNGGAQLDYGWVRVNINNAAGTFTIVDWAYDDAGVAITTPVPEPTTIATLGLFAAGAAGVGIYRRRKTVQ